MNVRIVGWALALSLPGALRVTAQTPDPLEPNDTPASAVAIHLPVLLSGLTLHTPAGAQGDVDRFAFDLAAGQQVVAQLLDPGDSSVDPLLLLVDDSGVVIASSDGIAGSTFGSVAFTATRSGAYQVIVTGTGDTQATGAHSQAGAYLLAVNLAVEDSLEPNNSPAAASDLGAISLPLSARLDAGDVDWFRFDAIAGSEYWILIEGDENLAGDPRLGVFDAGGANLLAESDNHFGRFPALAFSAATAGVHFIAVSGEEDTSYSGAHSRAGAYRLRFFERSADPYEDNDDLASAAAVALPLSAELDLKAGARGDVDFLKFRVALGDQIRLRTVDPGEIRLGTRVGAFDATSGALLAMASVISPQDPFSELILRSPIDGMLAVAVTGRSDDQFIGNHNESGPYNLRLAIDMSEPNDEIFSAHTLSGPGTVADLAMLDGDVDWFRFTLAAGDQWRLACLPAEGIHAHLRMGLFDASARLIEEVEGNAAGVLPALQVRASLSAPSTFFLAVTGDDDSAFQGLHTVRGGYGLKVTSLRPQVREVGPPAIGLAGALVRLRGSGFTTARDLEVSFGGQSSVIRTIASGTEVFVEAPAHPAGGLVDVEVSTINGRSVLAGGFRYIQAHPLVPGQTFLGHVSTESDWISFQVLGRTELDLDLKGVAPARLGDGQLRIYDANLVERDLSPFLRVSTARARVRRFPIPVGSGGTWYVEIRSSGGTGGDYSLRTRRKIGRELSKPSPAAGAGSGNTLEWPLRVEAGSLFSAKIRFNSIVQLVGAQILDGTRTPIPGTAGAIRIDVRRARVTVRKALLPSFGSAVLVVDGTGNAAALVKSSFKIKFPRSPRDRIHE